LFDPGHQDDPLAGKSDSARTHRISGPGAISRGIARFYSVSKSNGSAAHGIGKNTELDRDDGPISRFTEGRVQSEDGFRQPSQLRSGNFN
jgi:hypothetical protein